MAVGARDQIDQLLVKKYANEKVDNHENVASLVNPTKMYEAMNDYAAMHRNMIELKLKLQQACYSVNARCAHYKPSKNIQAS